jgi:hypothetical protein
LIVNSSSVERWPPLDLTVGFLCSIIHQFQAGVDFRSIQWLQLTKAFHRCISVVYTDTILKIEAPGKLHTTPGRF